MAICKVEGCGSKAVSRGFCPKHLYRFKKYGDPNVVSAIYGDTSKRLKSKVSVDENGCWIWQGSISPNGYGTTTHKNKRISSHRLSYLTFKGEIPKGLFVCHSCDIKACINPDHLFVGTGKDNMQDMLKKGRNPVPWSKGKTRMDSKKLDDAVKKATRVRRTNYLKKCKIVYEYKNDTGSTYKKMQDVFCLSDRQLFDRYKYFEMFLKGGDAHDRPQQVPSTR